MRSVWRCRRETEANDTRNSEFTQSEMLAAFV